MHVSFEKWTGQRGLSSYGTNNGARELPFQGWRHFKEAFAPELIARGVKESKIAVSRCLDPFGGSGTTALACQFLGVMPITAEVNPFLADLIEAKLETYNPDHLIADLSTIAREVTRSRIRAARIFRRAPKSFVEPGLNGRWIFDLEVADRLAAFVVNIERLGSQKNKRFFRVILGGILVECSNIVVNGKGRRYRRGWEKRRRSAEEISELFYSAAQSAIVDVHSFGRRKELKFKLLRGDCRELIGMAANFDLAIFSPPYPNSFDYTDVYNVELWTLGYLANASANRSLRLSTLCSHVQSGRDFLPAPSESRKLQSVLSSLERRRNDLWDPRIPEMIGGYFADLGGILERIRRQLSLQGEAWLVVGDSRYIGVQIQTAYILAEMARKQGWKVRKLEPFRSMRLSSQQGGQQGLEETLIVLRRDS